MHVTKALFFKFNHSYIIHPSSHSGSSSVFIRAAVNFFAGIFVCESLNKKQPTLWQRQTHQRTSSNSIPEEPDDSFYNFLNSGYSFYSFKQSYRGVLP